MANYFEKHPVCKYIPIDWDCRISETSGSIGEFTYTIRPLSVGYDMPHTLEFALCRNGVTILAVEMLATILTRRASRS